MKRKLNKMVLIEILVLTLISGDLLRTFYILAFENGCLTYFGCIILFLEIIVGGICYEELETRIRKISF